MERWLITTIICWTVLTDVAFSFKWWHNVYLSRLDTISRCILPIKHERDITTKQMARGIQVSLTLTLEFYFLLKHGRLWEIYEENYSAPTF